MILIGFSVPISVALGNFLLVIVLFGVLFNAPDIGQILRENPVARATELLFAALSFTAIYGAISWREALGTFGEYIDLVFVSLFNSALLDHGDGLFFHLWQRRCLRVSR